MGLQFILKQIEEAAEEELAQLEEAVQTETAAIVGQAERQAADEAESVLQTVRRTAAFSRSRSLHQARLEALQAVAAAREEVAARVIAETSRRLGRLREDAAYPTVLTHLTEETLAAFSAGELSQQDEPGGTVLVDPRDESLMRLILSKLRRNLTVVPALACWGGLTVQSDDGRIRVMNTLESRLERALPYINEILAETVKSEVATCPASTMPTRA